MPGIFNLARVEELIKGEHPAFVFVVDTNILMNTPDPNAWQVEGEKSVFVIPDQYLYEIESIKNKPGPHNTSEKWQAREVSRRMYKLGKAGKITDGVTTQGGWVILVPSPARDIIQPELDKLVDIGGRFDVSDIKLLLLTRQLNEQSIPATLLTEDRDLFLLADKKGIPAHRMADEEGVLSNLQKRFPIVGLKRQVKKETSLSWWEKAFTEMEQQTKERTFEVEVMLTALHTLPAFYPNGFVVAEGRGLLREVDKDRSFLWTMPYLPDYSRTHNGHLLRNKGNWWVFAGEDDTRPEIHLEFLGGDKPDQPLLDAISERLLGITNPSFEDGKPSIQTPSSVMEQVMMNDMYQQAEDSEPVDPSELSGEEWDKMWEPFVLKDWLLALSGDGYDKNVGLLFQAVQNYWQVGDTYTFRVERLATSNPNG